MNFKTTALGYADLAENVKKALLPKDAKRALDSIGKLGKPENDVNGKHIKS